MRRGWFRANGTVFYRWRTPTALLGATALFAAAAVGQCAQTSASLDVAQSADALKPGEWVWAPGVAPAGPVLIYVDLSRQIVTVYRNGVRIGVSTISSGKKGHSTPTGVFTILERASVHHSSKYDEASMPFTERLTWDGVALHAGGVPGYPESHGCVHLPYGFAKALFAATRRGVQVVMAGNAATRPPTADSTVLQPTVATVTGDAPLPLEDAGFSWKPELSPVGPLTIVVSKPDKMVVVLRNGVEIGRGAARIDADDDESGSHVITLTDWPEGRRRFVYVGVPGHEDDMAETADDAPLDQTHLAAPFLKNVKAQLEPGTTMLFTDADLGEDVDGTTLPADVSTAPSSEAGSPAARPLAAQGRSPQ